MYSDEFRADPYAIRCFVERVLTKEERMCLMRLREAHATWCVQCLRTFDAMELPDSVRRLFSLNDIAPSSQPGASRWQSMRLHNTNVCTQDLCDSDAWHELTLYAVLGNTTLADECNAVLEYASDECDTCEHPFLLDVSVQIALGYLYTELLMKAGPYGSDVLVTKNTRLMKETTYGTTLPKLQLDDESLTTAKMVLFLFVQTLQLLIERLREQDTAQEIRILGENGLLYHVMRTVISAVSSKLPADTLITITDEWAYLGFFLNDKTLDPVKVADLACNTTSIDEQEDEQTPFTDDSNRWPTSYLLTFETGNAKPQTVTLDHDSTITVCAGETRLTVTVKKGAKHDN